MDINPRIKWVDDCANFRKRRRYTCAAKQNHQDTLIRRFERYYNLNDDNNESETEVQLKSILKMLINGCLYVNLMMVTSQNTDFWFDVF